MRYSQFLKKAKQSECSVECSAAVLQCCTLSAREREGRLRVRAESPGENIFILSTTDQWTFCLETVRLFCLAKVISNWQLDSLSSQQATPTPLRAAGPIWNTTYLESSVIFSMRFVLKQTKLLVGKISIPRRLVSDKIQLQIANSPFCETYLSVNCMDCRLF